MLKSFLRICSMLLVIVMVANTLPLQCYAAEMQNSIPADATVQDSTSANVQIVEENPNKRTEYSKEFKMNNGLYMAVVYPDAVHYMKDGQWKDIDNTLKLSADGTYTNTAGVWNVQFPQQLSGNNSVSITKDGYTISFAMAGEIVNSGELMRAASISETLAVSGAQISTARVETVDHSAQKAAAEYPETVPDKLRSRLAYNEVYQNTNVIYDLDSNKVKESIVINRYNSALRGYRYTLQVGSLVPVLEDSGQILFFTPDKKDVVMVMPAPYLLDANYAHNNDIQVTLTGSGSTYTLTYRLPQQWLAEEDRAWPVILDPVIEAETNALNIKDRCIAENEEWPHNHHWLEAGYDVDNGKTRSYLKFERLPELTSSDVVVGATIQLYQPTQRINPNMSLCVEVHKVTGTWNSQTITWSTQPTFTTTTEDYCMVRGTPRYYGWVITDIVRSWYADGNNGLMFKSTDAVEAAGVANWMQFASSDYNAGTSVEDAPKPLLFIQFRNNNGLESYWDYTTSSAGRAGTGYVNNFTGNLVWVRNDIGFGGNRMPVSINHVYNANDAITVNDSNNSNDTSGNFFGLGYGWRTNFHQRLYQWSLDSNYYVWEDADGTDHYFEADTAGVIKDEDGLELTLTIGSNGTSKYILTDKQGNTSHFDTYGRLRKQQNNQATPSSINITYTTDTGPLISTITDGVGRVYSFTYTGDLLTRISYKGSGTNELSHVTFEYGSSNLTKITDKDDKASIFTYTNHLLTTATDIDGYTLTYAYNTVSQIWQPYRVVKISEADGTALGGELNIAYAHNQTTFTDHNGNVEIVQFNDFGNTISVQDDEGRATFAQYALNTDAEAEDNQDSTKKGNQLRLSSKLQNTVGNVLYDSSFEKGTVWYNSDSSIGNHNPANAAIKYSGARALYIYRGNTNGAGYIYTDSFYVAPGETYTFSGYVCNDPSSVYLALSDGTTTVTSDILAPQSNWVRLEVTYTNNTSSYKSLTPQMYSTKTGYVFLDCVQVEKAPTASRYNLIENGDFRYGTQGWSLDSLTGTDGTVTSTDPAPATELENTIAQLTGNPETVKHIYQRVMVSGAEGDTFVLSGWAKGDSVPLLEGTERDIGLYLCFNFADGSYQIENFHFNPDTGSQNSWQYGSWAAVAEKAYSSINIDIRYDYNMNTAYFDGIQLYKEEFGSSYTYDEDGNVISVVDLQKQETTYEYTENQLTLQVLPSGSYTMYDYDDYHNVIAAVTDEEVYYSFAYDTYGNNTQVSVDYGSYTIVASATYSNSGNTLSTTTDTVGNVTTYSYNANTNVLEWVKYPEDTDATRTNYTYDQMYRMVSASAVTDTNLHQSATYTYTDDLLTRLQTPSTRYTFKYGDFGLRTEVIVGDLEEIGMEETLASYVYTDDRNHYLETLDYGNGDSIEYTYDDKGRVLTEEFEDGATVTYQYDNNGALATVTDSETGIKTTYYYDFTDRTMKYVESGAGYSHSVGYEYDRRNNMTAMVETINGVKHTTSYTYDYDNMPLTTTSGVSQKENFYDGLDRVTSSEIKHNGDTVITDEWYYAGNGSTNTSRLPNAYFTYLNGNTVFDIYTYDDNGNIVFVEGSQGFIFYTYDSANQLIREDNEGTGKTKTWTYTAAGNILTRSEYPYTTPYEELGTPTKTIYYYYEEPALGDYLSYYDNLCLVYRDEIGNLTREIDYETGLEKTFTWKHGRQLATMSDGTTTWTYTYNADGMRTKRTNGTTTYNYVYNGSQLTQMTVGSNTLYISYDASGRPFTLNYNGAVYYYVLNMLGDVVGIANSAGTLVVRYWYDAWGYAESCTGTMASTLGVLNPLRYRSYVYDQETGLYYVSSRYYDPEIGRWINADDTAYLGADGTLLSYNLFAYCKNNPVMGYDPTGHFGLVGAIIATGAIVGGLLGAFSAATTGGNVLESAIEGCLTGALGAACGLAYTNPLTAALVAGVGGAVVDVGTQVVTQYLTTKKVDVAEIDPWRAVKAGVQTGIGAAIPAFGDATKKAVDAFGTALMWAEASTIIVCADVVVTKTIAAVQSSSKGTSRNWRGKSILEREMLLI